MPIHIIKLKDRYQAASDAYVFKFEKPAGMRFKPGQYGGFTLINPKQKDENGITRRFSILSTPDDDSLSIVTRINSQQNSAFKRELQTLAAGDEIKFAGPTGNFVLKDEDNFIVLMAGGIGISPFYSMIQHEARHGFNRHIYLFYGNRSYQDAAFLDELITLRKNHPNFHLCATLEKPNDDWADERGFITPSMITRHMSLPKHQPRYYVCGSPAMVTALQEMLVEMAIPEDRILVEDFPGY